MNKIAIFYGPLGGNTERVAKKVADTMGHDKSVLIHVKDATEMDLEPYSKVIFGGPTTGTHTWRDDHENDWDHFLARMTKMDLSGKKCAIFGLGDHVAYSHHFVDDIGVMAERVEKAGGQLVGLVPVSDYIFDGSKAQRGDKFLGLPIDEDFESEKTDKRIESWVDQLLNEF